ncbi:MAG: sigma-54-dependent Fis family transcriptional regulator [Zetaproteobacteria bacterium]|nr:MAG: sigma-54-dependent Fis family transcriptional regulator [Zetaproteobacteria bacterium]
MHEKILIIDDEKDICMLIQGLLEDEGYTTLAAHNSNDAYTIIDNDVPDLIIQDIWLQGSQDDGIKILKTTKETYPTLPFIMISGHGTVETAVSAIKLGAYDFIEKPFQSDRLLLMIHRALENATLKQQNIDLKQRTVQRGQNFTAEIPAQIRQTLDKVAPTNSRILITGEAGSGKNISAQYIHEKSVRGDMPFMVLNCASMDSEKLEMELFGTVQNAQDKGVKSGLLELVNGGTLLLDEVMSLPIETQGKVLNFLQDAAYHKVGSNHKIPVDIRVIATTSTDVDEKISSGAFREDLYYRLNVVPVHMPPLRQRRQDIIELIAHYSSLSFSELAVAKLRAYQWPGNIKQLHNVLEWISIMNENLDKPIDIENLPPEFGGGSANNGDQGVDNMSLFVDTMMQMGLREARECFERHYLLSQVNKFDGNISKTAEFVGMERSALHRKLKSLDVFSNDKQSVA